jgi:methylated-DNA-[protein]-cysteine S-methyltransferase
MAMPETHGYAALEMPVGRLYVAYAGETPRLISASGEEVFLARVRKVCGMLPVRNDGARLRMLRRILATILGPCPYPGPLDLSRLTPFQQEVLLRTVRIPRGEVRSYAWLAQELGRPRAWRAVGTALARNPLPFIPSQVPVP